jgi:hypothetical protein
MSGLKTLPPTNVPTVHIDLYFMMFLQVLEEFKLDPHRMSVSSAEMSDGVSAFSDHSTTNLILPGETEGLAEVSVEQEELDPTEAQRRHEHFEQMRREHYRMKEVLRKGKELAEHDLDEQ